MIAAVTQVGLKNETTNDDVIINYSTTQRPRKYIKTQGTREQANVEWEEQFQLFLQFKAEIGDASITQKRLRRHTKYAKLEQWNVEEKERIKDYRNRPAMMVPDDREKAKKLLAEGYMTSGSQKWETSYAKMKAYQD